MKKIIKSVELSYSTSYVGEGRSDSAPVGAGTGGGSVAGLTPIPNYLRKYADPSYRPGSNNVIRSEFVSADSSPFAQNYKASESPRAP